MRHTRQKGAALFEFMLIAPVLLILLFGIIEMGIILYDKAIITNASREGARYGIVLRDGTYADSAAVTAYSEAYCTSYLLTFGGQQPTVSVAFAPSSTPQEFGDTLSVTVSFTYTGLLLYSLIGIDQQLNLSATTVMTYE